MLVNLEDVSNCSFYLDDQKILYNLFGCYVQFLPVIMERIVASKKTVGTKLNQLLKLSKWNGNRVRGGDYHPHPRSHPRRGLIIFPIPGILHPHPHPPCLV